MDWNKVYISISVAAILAGILIVATGRVIGIFIMAVAGYNLWYQLRKRARKTDD